MRTLLPRVLKAFSRQPKKIAKPSIESSPLLQSGDLLRYISDRLLRAKDIDLYSAFQLHHEAMRIHRLSYRQPAWSYTCCTGDLYRLFMHCLTARAFACSDQCRAAEDWFDSDIPFLNSDGRAHHFASRLQQGKALLYDNAFLQRLADMRIMYRGKTTSEREVPYHFNCFPWDAAAPEEELLHPGSQSAFKQHSSLDLEVEQVLVELVKGPWT